MGLFDDFLDAPEAPDARDAWTRQQQHYLLNPLAATTGQSLFGDSLDPLKARDAGLQLQQDPYAYQGQYAAGVSPLQQQYFNQAPQVAGQQLRGLGGISRGQAPLDDIYNYGQRFANDVITPNVMERFAGLGTADSGGAQRGLARELGTYGLGLSSQIGQASLQNQGQQLQALGLMGQVPQQVGLAGGEQRNVAQQQISGDIQRSQALHPLSSPQAQVGLNLLGLRSTPQPQPAGFGYSLLTGAAGSQGVGDALGAGLSSIGGGIKSLFGF